MSTVPVEKDHMEEMVSSYTSKQISDNISHMLSSVLAPVVFLNSQDNAFFYFPKGKLLRDHH